MAPMMLPVLFFLPSPTWGEGLGERAGACRPSHTLALELTENSRPLPNPLPRWERELLQLRLLNLLLQIPIQKLNHMDEHPKPFVLGLAVEEAVVDLLQDHHQSENAVDRVEVEVGHAQA